MSGRRRDRVRLDQLLVERGLCPGVDQAQRRIWSGEVIVDGEMLDRPGTPVLPSATIRLRSRRGRYATRGGEKLERALSALSISVEGRCIIDVGAAGGGFTDCLLAHGATRVYALDVARGQLAQRLRLDPRVVDLGGRDIMALEARELEPIPDFATVDVTFRALSDILPRARGLLAPQHEMLALVKPLHEARLAGIGREDDLHPAVFDHLLNRLRAALIPVRDVVPSLLPGPGGALEFFLHVGQPGRDEADLSQRVSAAIAEGSTRLSRRARPGRSGQARRKRWRRFSSRGG